MTVQMLRKLFTVDEFYRMAEAGIFQPDDRLELIHGEIVEMVPTGSHHATVVDRIAQPLTLAADSAAIIVRVQGPVRLDLKSEVFPDVSLLTDRSYWDGHPRPEDVLLLVEVADSTLLSDQRVKLPLYAENRIPEVWIVNLTNETIEVYARPVEDGYSSVRIAGHGDVVSPQALPAASIVVDHLFG